MAPSEIALALRARRAYELGRLRQAARALPVVAAMVGCALLGCGRVPTTIALGALLAAAVVALVWWGRAPGRAVRAGLSAGAAPLLVPLVLRPAGQLCVGGVCLPSCALVCVATGLAAGAVVALRAARLVEQRLAFFAAAAAVAALAGSLGCAVAGASGVLGMAAGLAATSLPSLLVPRGAERA
jgi:hypothetical protein